MQRDKLTVLKDSIEKMQEKLDSINKQGKLNKILGKAKLRKFSHENDINNLKASVDTAPTYQDAILLIATTYEKQVDKYIKKDESTKPRTFFSENRNDSDFIKSQLEDNPNDYHFTRALAGQLQTALNEDRSLVDFLNEKKPNLGNKIERTVSNLTIDKEKYGIETQNARSSEKRPDSWQKASPVKTK